MTPNDVRNRIIASVFLSLGGAAVLLAYVKFVGGQMPFIEVLLWAFMGTLCGVCSAIYSVPEKSAIHGEEHINDNPTSPRDQSLHRRFRQRSAPRQ